MKLAKPTQPKPKNFTPIRTQVNVLEPHTPPNNKYDSRWINKELRSQVEYLQSHENIVTKIQLFEHLPYSKNKWDYWVSKNGTIPSIQETQTKVNEILESRLIQRGFDSKNPVFSIFLLKNNYNYQDKRELENNNNYNFIVSRGNRPTIKPRPPKQIKATSTIKESNSAPPKQ